MVVTMVMIIVASRTDSDCSSKMRRSDGMGR